MSDNNPFGKDYINDESGFEEPEPDHGSEMEDNPDSEVLREVDKRIQEEEERLYMLKEVRGAIESLQTDLDVDIGNHGYSHRDFDTYSVTLEFRNGDSDE